MCFDGVDAANPNGSLMSLKHNSFSYKHLKALSRLGSRNA